MKDFLKKKHMAAIAVFSLAATFLWANFELTMAAHAQPMISVPRWNGNQTESLTNTAPSANPQPAYQTFQLGCANPPCTGQSASVPGALHLDGCGTYSVVICADAGTASSTLNGSGFVDIYGWPEFPNSDGGVNQWSENVALRETVTKSTACQTFQGHVANRYGWIFGNSRAVTTLQPSDAGFDGGAVNIQIEAACAN